MPELDFYPQHMEEFAADEGDRRREYDVLLFFNFHQSTPDSDRNAPERDTRAALEQLGEVSKAYSSCTMAFWHIHSGSCGQIWSAFKIVVSAGTWITGPSSR